VAVEGQTDPHQVVVQTAAAQGAGGVGEVTAAGIQPLLPDGSEHLLEPLALGAGERVLPLARGIGIRQMRIDARQRHRVQSGDGLHQTRALGPGSTETGHARVELEVHRQPPATAAGQVLTEQGLPHAAEGGHQLPVEAGAQLLRLGEVAEHQQRMLDARLAQLHPLLQRGHPEAAGPAGGGGARHRHGTVAVAIGLDHRHQVGTRGQMAAERRGVGADRRLAHLHPGPLTRMGPQQRHGTRWMGWRGVRHQRSDVSQA